MPLLHLKQACRRPNGTRKWTAVLSLVAGQETAYPSPLSSRAPVGDVALSTGMLPALPFAELCNPGFQLLDVLLNLVNVRLLGGELICL